MLTCDEAKALVEKHGGNKTAAAASVGVSPGSLGRALDGKTVAKSAAAPGASGRTISIDDALKSLDKVGEVLAVVTRLPAGQLKQDDDLRVELGMGSDRWRRVRGSARLAGYWHQMPSKELLWGNKRTIEMLAERAKELML